MKAFETLRVSFLIISPFMLIAALLQLSSESNSIQQFLVKFAFLKGSDIVIALYPYSFSTIDLISYLEISFEMALMKSVPASGSKP